MQCGENQTEKKSDNLRIDEYDIAVFNECILNKCGI